MTPSHHEAICPRESALNYLTEKATEFTMCVVLSTGLRTRQRPTLYNIACYQKSHKSVTESLEFMKNDEEISWCSVIQINTLYTSVLYLWMTLRPCTQACTVWFPTLLERSWRKNWQAMQISTHGRHRLQQHLFPPDLQVFPVVCLYK